VERDKNIDTVLLAFDNDEGGLRTLTAAKEGLAERGYSGKIVEFLPLECKDWNDFHSARVRNKPSKDENSLNDFMHQINNLKISHSEVINEATSNDMKNFDEKR